MAKPHILLSISVIPYIEALLSKMQNLSKHP